VGRDPATVRLNVGFRFPNAASDMRPSEVDRKVWLAARDYIDGCEELGIDRVILTTRIPVEGYDETMTELADTLGLRAKLQTSTESTGAHA
jgi:hypothetical protein